MNKQTPSGLIFNMQKFSLHDGPGIRTVVFFKGCPLSCKWCANPESQQTNIQLLWDKASCQHCQTCMAACPAKAISFHNKQLLVDNSICQTCQLCAASCPHKAISFAGEAKSVAEVISFCLQDIDFYEESKGGVTLSGGEVLMQPDFAIALLKELKANHIHTALETTGYAQPEIFTNVTRYADLLLFDIKHWDEASHIKGTGVSNKLILQNLQQAITGGKTVLPRLPVIPGFNAELADASQFAQLLNKLGAARVQLLPFHQFGEKKYTLLNEPYAYTDTPPLQEGELLAYQQCFLAQGINAFF